MEIFILLYIVFVLILFNKKIDGVNNGDEITIVEIIIGIINAKIENFDLNSWLGVIATKYENNTNMPLI